MEQFTHESAEIWDFGIDVFALTRVLDLVRAEVPEGSKRLGCRFAIAREVQRGVRLRLCDDAVQHQVTASRVLYLVVDGELLIRQDEQDLNEAAHENGAPVEDILLVGSVDLLREPLDVSSRFLVIRFRQNRAVILNVLALLA